MSDLRDRLIDYFDTIWPDSKEEMADHVLTLVQPIDRHAITIILNLLVASGSVYPKDVAAAVDAIVAVVRHE